MLNRVENLSPDDRVRYEELVTLIARRTRGKTPDEREQRTITRLMQEIRRLAEEGDDWACRVWRVTVPKPFQHLTPSTAIGAAQDERADPWARSRKEWKTELRAFQRVIRTTVQDGLTAGEFKAKHPQFFRRQN